LIRPKEVLSSILDPGILEVASNPLW
jgi:hypothetical protein